MEFLLLIIFVFVLIGWIKESIENKKKKIRNNVAKEILSDFNYKKEKNEIVNIINFYKMKKKKILKKFSFLNNDNICPLCNENLQLINGKYGKFWGCRGYPNCHFIKKI